MKKLLFLFLATVLLTACASEAKPPEETARESVDITTVDEGADESAILTKMGMHRKQAEDIILEWMTFYGQPFGAN